MPDKREAVITRASSSKFWCGTDCATDCVFPKCFPCWFHSFQVAIDGPKVRVGDRVFEVMGQRSLCSQALLQVRQEILNQASYHGLVREAVEAFWPAVEAGSHRVGHGSVILLAWPVLPEALAVITISS